MPIYGLVIMFFRLSTDPIYTIAQIYGGLPCFLDKLMKEGLQVFNSC